MVIFRFFQDGVCPPSWIGFTHVWTPYEEYLVVFVTVKFGWNRCSSFDNVQVFYFLHIRLENVYSRLQNRSFGRFDPQNERDPKGTV